MNRVPKVPKHSSYLSSRDTPFIVWWNDRYFEKKPWMTIYEALHKAKADLGYIEYLRDILWVYESLLRDPHEFEELKRVDVPAFWRDLHPSRVTKVARIAGKIHGALHPKRSRFLDDGERERIEEGTRNLLRKKHKALREKTLKAYDQNVESYLKQSPNRAILLEYGRGNLLYRTGRGSDEVGSFFLLAVSEHLREETGRPNFLLANKLLKSIREEPIPSDSPLALQAKARVKKLQGLHPKWSLHLKILKKRYREL